MIFFCLGELIFFKVQGNNIWKLSRFQKNVFCCKEVCWNFRQLFLEIFCQNDSENILSMYVVEAIKISHLKGSIQNWQIWILMVRERDYWALDIRFKIHTVFTDELSSISEQEEALSSFLFLLCCPFSCNSGTNNKFSLWHMTLGFITSVG